MADRRLALEARRIRAGYGSVLALDDVTFGLPQGGVVAVLGANGAGKSTLLSVLSGQIQPWDGEVRVDGAPIRGLRSWDVAHRGVCCVPEGGGIFQELTVRENLSLAGTAGRHRPDLGEVLELFPILGKRQHQRAGSLSGGEKRMLALGRAVLARPSVLLVDEPSLGLAPIVVDEVFGVLGRLNSERGMSIVVVEQYVDRALAMASWAFVLTKGRVTYAGSVEELASSGAVEAAYLGASIDDTAVLDPSPPIDAPAPGPARRPGRRRSEPLRSRPGSAPGMAVS